MPLYQHRFHGATAGGDIFVFSWWVDTAESSVTVMNDFAVDWITAFWNGPGGTDGYGSIATAATAITRVTTGEIAQATGQQQTLAEEDVSLPGTSLDNTLPADLAIVVSLRTQQANRQGRGRFYLPPPVVSTVDADGRITAAAVATILDALEPAWSAYNVAKTPVVYSRTARSIAPVTSFNVGDLFDTQRRRENALTEVRSSRTMP